MQLVNPSDDEGGECFNKLSNSYCCHVAIKWNGCLFHCSGDPTAVWWTEILFWGPCLKFQLYRPPGLVTQGLSMAFMSETMGRFHSSNSNETLWLEEQPYPKYLSTCTLPVMVQTNYWLAELFFCEKCKIMVEKSESNMCGTWRNGIKVAYIHFCSINLGWCGNLCLVNGRKGKTPFCTVLVQLFIL